MNISNCPRCGDPFRVPVEVLEHDAQAQCPWCGERFPLSEVIDRLPPVLTILSADGTALNQHWQPATGVKSNTGSLPDDLDGFVLAHDGPAIDETVAFTDDVSIDLANHAVSTAPTVHAARRRNSGGGLRSLLGVVMGGLLALPIAGGILWGLGLGPFAESELVRRNQVASKPVELQDDRRPIETPRMSSQELDSGVESTDGEADLEDAGLSMPPLDPTTLDPVALDPAPDVQMAIDQVATPMAETTEPAEQSLEIVDVELQPESEELIKTVDVAVQMINALSSFDRNNEKWGQYLETAYQTVAKAGALAQSDGERIRELASAVKASSILDELSEAGTVWMSDSSRTHDGVLIVGTTDGESLTLESGQQVKLSGSVSLPASGRVVAIGRILDPQSVSAVVTESLAD